ncbi:hypothetical protein ILUMI_12468 [Ignelater luminosus]|uniref:Uncharacterized protein n=1 Tax=Ignelater luminosus TaxID=2038154 RepID=A0A8K0CU55_IGNLU|nr:hypothetical protein ILUMI_12468 [Ignelater luminosus]
MSDDAADTAYLICKLCELCCLCSQCCIEICEECQKDSGRTTTNQRNNVITTQYAPVNSATTEPPSCITNGHQEQHFLKTVPQPSAPIEQPLLRPLGFGDIKTDVPPSYEEATRNNLTESTMKNSK